jgi:hypothetical protein
LGKFCMGANIALGIASMLGLLFVPNSCCPCNSSWNSSPDSKIGRIALGLNWWIVDHLPIIVCFIVDLCSTTSIAYYSRLAMASYLLTFIGGALELLLFGLPLIYYGWKLALGHKFVSDKSDTSDTSDTSDKLDDSDAVNNPVYATE